MRKRPTLKVGDVCKLSKRVASQGVYKDAVLVVTGFSNGYDTSDGRTMVHGHLTYNDWGTKCTRSSVMYRRNLWKTGYNVFDKSTKGKSVVPKANPVGAVRNNDGRTHCYKCGKPTTFVPGAISGGYHMCKNQECEWYDN